MIRQGFAAPQARRTGQLRASIDRGAFRWYCSTMKKTIELDLLKGLLSYDPDSGEFRWIEQRGRANAGDVAGTEWKGHATNSYRIICVNKIKYLAHRLAWFYVTGDWLGSETQIDHKDGNGLNNSIKNLRIVVGGGNQHNRGSQSNSKSGIKGVVYDSKLLKWRAGIRFSKKYIHLGRFDSAEEAGRAYLAKAKELHGEFYRE